jgi:two-component system, LytTR family, sensor kinase
MYSKKNFWLIHTAYWILCEGHNLFIVIYFGVPHDGIYIKGLLYEFFSVFIGTYLFSRFIYARNYTLKNWKITLTYSFISCNILSMWIAYLHLRFYSSVLQYHLFTPTKIPIFIYLYFDCLRYIYPWFGVFHLFRLYTASFRNQVKKNQNAMALKIAELENLKNQLNPHFLFNSLNSIKALTLSNITLAREAIIELAELLRTSLDFRNTSEIFLYQEMKLVEKYLALEKIRFEDRLNYTIDILGEVMSFKIPPMAVQLLVENAIKHGVNNSKKGGHIIILGYRENNFLIIQVKNSGKMLTNERKGVGIENLDKRLELNYGKEAKFTLQEISGEVIAEIQVPIIV